MKIGVIGGTGLYDPKYFGEGEVYENNTPYGKAALINTSLGDTDIIFLSRHGSEGAIPPHRINYKANIYSLYQLGVSHIISTFAVGALDPELQVGDMVVVDQFLDFTKSRDSTFNDDSMNGVYHVECTNPYCEDVREALFRSAKKTGSRVNKKGTYVCAEGPRYETAAEIRMYSSLGGHVVGMTGVPEVVLAREAGLCYGALSIVTNYAAGIADEKLNHSDVIAQMHSKEKYLFETLTLTVKGLPDKRTCSCPDNGGIFSNET